jgi:hypothetical protein
MRTDAPVRPAANAASTGTFDGESADDERVSQRRVAERRRSSPSQNGTSPNAPIWHGPLLKPSFVAQVLGQVLMEHRARALARAPAAYSNDAHILQGLCLNRDV